MAEIPISATAQSLYVDPAPTFKPSLDFIDTQRTQTNERYATNKADIANIFGSLTQVNTESQNRVNKQFQESIVNQQMGLATRTAAARTGMAQTAQAAQDAGMERGGGPAGNPMASPVAIAGERGIADSNAFATVFEGQQRAINAQTIQNLQAANTGFGFQQVEANMNLKRSLEGTLNQLSGQEAGVRQDIAQARLAGRGKVREANYNETMSAQAARAAQSLAATRGAASTRNAAINAQNRLDLANIKAGQKIINYPNDATGITRYLNDNGFESSGVEAFWNSISAIDFKGVSTSNAAFAKWKKANPKADTEVQIAARDWLSRQRYDRPVDTRGPATGIEDRFDFGNTR